MVTKQDKLDLITKFGKGPEDSGSSEAQVAILTMRITDLTSHFSKNIHDHHSKRGLMKMIGRRRRLLRYINSKSPEKYTKLIRELGLRK